MRQVGLSAMRAHVFAVVASVLWASAFLGGKYALQFLPPLRLAGIRLLIAALLLLVYLRKNPFARLRGNWFWIIVLSLVQTVVVFSMFNLGLNLVPGSFGAVIIGSSPAVSSLLAILLVPGESLTLRKGIGLVIGVAGIALLAFSRQPWTEVGQQQLLGASLLMVCNIATALGSIIMKRHLSHVDPVAVNFTQILLGGIIIMLLSLAFEPVQVVPVDVALVASVCFLAFITATAVSLWMRIMASDVVKISVISLWKFLIPSLGPVLSWMFVAGDSPTWPVAAGMLTIVCSIVLTVWEGSGKRMRCDVHSRSKYAILGKTGEIEP